MTFTVTTKDSHEHTKKWLLLWQGMLGLTDREREVLTEIIVLYLELSTKILDEQLLWQNMWDTPSRKRIQEALSISRFSLGNYLSDFRKNGLINDNDQLLLSLIPQDTFTVHFT